MSCHPAYHGVPAGQPVPHDGRDAAHTPTSASDVCTVCHSETLPAIHGATVYAPTNCASCHATHAPANAACDICHASTTTWSKTADCTSCHAADLHGDLNAKHVSAGGADFISAGLENGDHDLGYGENAACSDCHVTSLVALHVNYCGACHSETATEAVKTAVATHNTNCTACHPGQHTGGNGSHEDIYNTGCNCHDADWNNPTATCTDCHPAATPVPIPSTTSDAKSSYVNDAVINLTPSDNVSGSFGIKATYYRLDGASEITGTQITIPAPVTGTDVHTLSFWSTDWSGNTEATHTVLFTVAADSFPPVTTSNVSPRQDVRGRSDIHADRHGCQLDGRRHLVAARQHHRPLECRDFSSGRGATVRHGCAHALLVLA